MKGGMLCVYRISGIGITRYYMRVTVRFSSGGNGSIWRRNRIYTDYLRTRMAYP